MARAKVLQRLNRITSIEDRKCVLDHMALLDAAQRWYGFVCGTARGTACLSSDYVDLVREKVRAGVGVKLVFRGASFLRADALAQRNHLAELLKERDADLLTYHSLRVHLLPRNQGPRYHFAFADEQFGLMETFHREGDCDRTYVLFRDRLTVMALHRWIRRHIDRSREVLDVSQYEALPNYAPEDESVPRSRRPDLAKDPVEYADTALYNILLATQEEVFADFDRRLRDPLFADDPFTSVWGSTRSHVRKLQEEHQPASRFYVLRPSCDPAPGDSLVKLWEQNAAAARAGALVSYARA